ncbi:hypothetical protein FB566_1333 [Stackebrandtia endophytica]|uniref:Uncharacterized protein n=2 Tax=Stackebrandtia endophytica TaxID=1496996 RepID=A0A543ATB5_9ACTN|nr:hypothetical protein FB566_1333 [Stackebrandtia endophytica]
MQQRQWFRCQLEYSMEFDELRRLRAAVTRLYQAKVAIHYGFIAVTISARVNGFDRLAARLSYSRILTEYDHIAEVTLTASGPIVGLCRIDRDWETVFNALPRRLARGGPLPHAPGLRMEPLPVEVKAALTLLEDMST